MKKYKKLCVAALSLLMLSSCGGKKDPSTSADPSFGGDSVQDSSSGKTEIKDA